MKKGSQILYFFKEILIVVIGVLIAVSISNYKEHVDDIDYIEKTLLAIENEIELSQLEVDTVLNKHQKMFDVIENNIDSTDLTIGELVSSSGGFQIASVKNVSLRFFVSNKAELLEFDLISQLLDIELKTDLLTDKLKRLGDFAYENVNDGSEEVKTKFLYLVASVIDGEETLLQSYSDFIRENKSVLKKYK